MMSKYFYLLLISVSLVTSALMAEEYFFFSPHNRASHLKNYTEEEQAAIDEDLKTIRNICLPKVQERAFLG